MVEKLGVQSEQKNICFVKVLDVIDYDVIKGTYNIAYRCFTNTEVKYAKVLYGKNYIYQYRIIQMTRDEYERAILSKN